MALTTPRVRVVLEDGTEHTVRMLNVDQVAYDRERGRRPDLPSGLDAPMLYQTWCAWHALTRLHLIPAWNYAEFEQKAWQVEPLDGEDPQEVDPTQTAAAPE
jgi:hypothetical protein